MTRYTRAQVVMDDDTDLADPGYVLQYDTREQSHLTERIDATDPEGAFREAARFLGRGPVECPECGKIEVREGDYGLYAVCPCCGPGWDLLTLPEAK